METSQRVRELINSLSKNGFTPLHHVVHGSGRGDQEIMKHLVFLCFCPDPEHHLDSTNNFFLLFALLVFFLSGHWKPETSYLVFCWVLCHVRVLFLCYSMLLHFGGHRDLRTLKALLCV